MAKGKTMAISAENSKVLKKCILAFTAVLLVEIFGFNIQSFFKPGLSEYRINPATAAANPSEIRYAADGYLHVNPDAQRASFALINANVPVKNVSLRISGSPQVASIRVFYRDSQERFHYYNAYNKLFAAGYDEREVFLKLKSDGDLQDVVFEISKNGNADFTIHSIRLNVAPPFSFSFLRFFVLLIPVLFIIISVSYRWYDIVTDFTGKNYKIGVTAAFFAAFLFSLFIFTAVETKDISYPFTVSQHLDDPYLLVFDAFKKGQVSLDVPADPKLIDLGEQVYSQGARENVQAFALHDYVFFKGKYYVYFGPAPVLFLYYPYYAATGSLPSPGKTAFILSVLCAFFVLKAFLQLLKTFCRKANLMLLLAVYLAIMFGSLIFMLQLFAQRYEIAQLGGYLFLAASIMFAFKAYNLIENSGEKKKVFAYLFLSGAAFISIGLARPNVLLAAFAFLLPVALKILSDKNLVRSYKIKIAAAFLSACAAGFAFIFWYNFARFGSIFDFGIVHQLTGIAPKGFSFDMILRLPHAVLYYFFDMPDFSLVFPWLHAGIHSYNISGRAFYGDVHTGIMITPLVLGIFIWWKTNPKYSKNDSLMKATAVSIFLGTAASLIVLFGLSGVVARYTCDIRLGLLYLAGLFMINAYNNIEPGYANTFIYRIFMLVCVLSIFTGFCLTFGGNYEMWNLVKNSSPELYSKLFNLFV